MLKLGNRTSAFALAGLLLGVSTVPAQAYLDAGTGSMILQLLLGGLAGMAIIAKFYWHRFLNFFGMGPKEGESQKDLSAEDAERRDGAKLDA